ncbi:MAG TPA: anthranilate phosphoribosyltransferase [Acidimicrobiales bacterium]|nr:anthranilate phosphoribosyltransferase [Acidimicrobiales bacterium]
MRGPGENEPGVKLSLVDIGGWPGMLGRLGAGQDLTSAEAAAAMREILEGTATASQIAAFIFGLRCKGETSEELTGMLRAMLEVAETVPLPHELSSRLVDTCGTGGDRAGTINVSTIAALVVAGAGVPVCKHGGRAASSRTGSADVLEALGVEITLPPASVARCIEQAGIGFCFAPRYHPAMRNVVQTRRELGVPTAFNLLGPLANPGRARYQLVGVGDGRVAERLARVLGAAGSERAWVVHGHDGLDELSTVAPSTVVEWVAGESDVRTFVVDPAALGLERPRPEELMGGDPAVNARAAHDVLAGSKGPQRDIVLLNAAGALVVVGEAGDLEEGLLLAAESLDGGRAHACLDRLVELSKEEGARTS